MLAFVGQSDTLTKRSSTLVLDDNVDLTTFNKILSGAAMLEWLLRQPFQTV